MTHDPRVPVKAFALDCPADVWLSPYLREVGESLSRGPAGSGLLVEELSTEPRPLLVPSDPWVERVLLSAADRIPVHLFPRFPLPRPEPPVGLDVWMGFVAPLAPAEGFAPPRSADQDRRDSRAATRRFTETSESALPEPPLDLGPGLPTDLGGWTGIQTHWFPSGDANLLVRFRFLVGGVAGQGNIRAWQVATTLARAISDRGGPATQVVLRRPRRRDRREWSEGSYRRSGLGGAFRLAPCGAAALLGWCRTTQVPESSGTELHSVVLGASGSGKSGWLAELARRHISQGSPVVVLDLHGDLAPAIVGHLAEPFRRQVIAIDAAAPTGQVPGVAVLGGGGTGPPDREVAQVVAALRRLSVDNGETYWGPRLERVFDTFVRAAQEEGGGLLDVHALLTDARRREACRLTTRSDEIARFLDELPAVLRRNPEFLWTAASRTAKLALDPRLAGLVAPSGPGLDVSALLDEGRSVLWRLPLGELGPEGAQVAANLLLSHVYLGRTAISERPSTRRPLLLVLDEAHAFSAPLLVEILAEGRKFGVRAILASQYPDRLSPSVRSAAAGAVGSHVLFRIPHPAAATAGSWTGLNPHEAQRILPVLPPGVALMASYGPRAGRRIVRVGPPGFADPRHWADRVAECSKVYAGPAPESSSHLADIEEALLLALLSGEVRGKRLGLPELVVETGRSPNLEIDPTDVVGRVPTLLRRGWISDDDGSYALTGAGHQRLGWTTATGASRESAEHRALLLLAYRIFARHAVRLEIVRQGRFDTRLPDARVTLLSARDGHRAPAEIAARIDRLRTAWVWKAFGGRDVFVEAEVSGADRPERLRRGVLKARHAGAFLLFLVGDGRRAAKVRSFLRSRDVERHLAQVWTLSSARLVRAPGATEGE